MTSFGSSWSPRFQEQYFEESESKSAFTLSPEQLAPMLPPDLSHVFPQPTPSIYPAAHDESHLADFVAVSPDRIMQTPSDYRGQPLQTDTYSVESYTSVFNPQTSVPAPSIMPTIHQSPVTVNADHSLVYNDSSPPGKIYFNQNHFSPSSSTALHQPDDSMMLNSSTIPPYLTSQSMTPSRGSQGGYAVVRSQTASLPAQAVPPNKALHACQWIGPDGATICAGDITWKSVSEHLEIHHGIRNMGRDFHVSCRWLGCRIKRGKGMINRESIVRHIRERHLGKKRSDGII